MRSAILLVVAGPLPRLARIRVNPRTVHKPRCLTDAECDAEWEQDNAVAPADADNLPPFSEAMGATSAEARMRLFEELPTGFGCAGFAPRHAVASSPERC